VKRRTCHPIYCHPFTDGAAVTPVEYHALIDAALTAGIAGIYWANKRIAAGRESAIRNVYHPN